MPADSPKVQLVFGYSLEEAYIEEMAFIYELPIEMTLR